jgi:hypothetical protein
VDRTILKLVNPLLTHTSWTLDISIHINFTLVLKAHLHLKHCFVHAIVKLRFWLSLTAGATLTAYFADSIFIGLFLVDTLMLQFFLQDWNGI